MISVVSVADHLWQSTLFAALAWLLTLALGRNRASIRHSIWLIASLKFFLPFSLLAVMGASLPFEWPALPTSPTPGISNILYWSRPLSVPASSVLQARPESGSAVFAGLLWLAWATWLAGVLTVMVYRYSRGRHLRTIVHEAWPLQEGREVEILNRVQAQIGRRPTRLASSRSTIEPGVYGVIDPVLLLPAGIADRLTGPELEAIVAHELSHLARRDNLTAWLPVAVETVFWFHPLVWWIGSRLVDERERACDESVLDLQENPQVYAGAILKVCEFYLMLPLTCIPGITSSNLKKRIEAIMTNGRTLKLNFGRKCLLVVVGAATLFVPIVLGSMQNSGGPVTTRLAFDVASIRAKVDDPCQDGVCGGPRPVQVFRGGRLVAGATLRELIQAAYSTSLRGFPLQTWRLSGGPEWMTSTRYAIEARAEKADAGQMAEMLRSLLKDRFHLLVHWETRQLAVYELSIAKGGHKLEMWKEGSCIGITGTDEDEDESGAPPPPPPPPPPPSPSGDSGPVSGLPLYCRIITMGGPSFGQLNAGKTTITQLIPVLELMVGRAILDKTGLTGTFNARLVFNHEPAAFSEQDQPGFVPPPNLAGLSLFGALEKQLGLKLESRKGPVSVLVIDSVDRPTEN
jgi:bla regulator protein blaR1